MTSREIFRIIAKTIGLIAFCYGVVVGVSGTCFHYLLDGKMAGDPPSIPGEGWLAALNGDLHWIVVYVITQGIVPVGLGLLLMGSDIIPDFCFPKRHEKRLESKMTEGRKFEISQDADTWKPPKF